MGPSIIKLSPRLSSLWQSLPSSDTTSQSFLVVDDDFDEEDTSEPTGTYPDELEKSIELPSAERVRRTALERRVALSILEGGSVSTDGDEAEDQKPTAALRGNLERRSTQAPDQPSSSFLDYDSEEETSKLEQEHGEGNSSKRRVISFTPSLASPRVASPLPTRLHQSTRIDLRQNRPSTRYHFRLHRHHLPLCTLSPPRRAHQSSSSSRPFPTTRTTRSSVSHSSFHCHHRY